MAKKHLAFIHGFLENATMWQYVLPHLSKSAYQIHLPELPGHGRNVNLPETHTAQSWCQDILNQMNLPAGEDVFIIGHSMGGYLAATMAAMIPGQVRGLCFFQSKAGADHEQKIAEREKAIEAAQTNKALYVRTMITNCFLEGNRLRCHDQIEKMVEDAKLLETETIVAAQQVMIGRPDRVADLKHRNFPLYYLYSEKDPSLPLDIIRAELHQLPGAMAQEVHNAAHMSHIESTKEAVEFLQRILRADM